MTTRNKDGNLTGVPVSGAPVSGYPADLSYRAPTAFIVVFYGLLAAWTVLCVFKLGSRLMSGGTGDLMQWLMIGFVITYTWIFSYRINYKISVTREGQMELTSLKRVLKVNAQDIDLVEGPHLPWGFLRFKLQREKAYLFCVVKDSSFRKVLAAVRSVNPRMRAKFI